MDFSHAKGPTLWRMPVSIVGSRVVVLCVRGERVCVCVPLHLWMCVVSRKMCLVLVV